MTAAGLAPVLFQSVNVLRRGLEGASSPGQSVRMDEVRYPLLVCQPDVP